MRKILSIFVILFISLMIFGCEKDMNVDPTPKPEGNVFSTVYVIGEAKQYEKLELALFENKLRIASDGNPYDYSYMKVVASITAPSGETLEMLAFWYQDYDMTFNTSLGKSPGSINGVASTVII